MKTIIKEIKVYSFDELSEDSQAIAVDNLRAKGIDTDYIYDEAYKTVKKFNDLFNIKSPHNSWLEFSTSHIDDNIIELKGLRLRKWIINNFGNELYTRKFYNSIGDNRIIKHPCIKVHMFDINKGARVSSSNFYYSRIQKTNSCVLTGVYYDDVILEPIYDLIQYTNRKDYNSYQDFDSLIRECFAKLEQCIENEVESIQTFEYLREEFIENGQEFTEDGEIY